MNQVVSSSTSLKKSSLPARKNRKAEEWIQVDLIVGDRKKCGKDSVVYEWAKPIDDKRRKATNRIRIPRLELELLHQSRYSLYN